MRQNHIKHKKWRTDSCESILRFSDRRRIRTFDRLLRRQVLYPAELCDLQELCSEIFFVNRINNVDPEKVLLQIKASFNFKINLSVFFKKVNFLQKLHALFCRGGRIRTCDLLLPKQAR